MFDSIEMVGRSAGDLGVFDAVASFGRIDHDEASVLLRDPGAVQSVSDDLVGAAPALEAALSRVAKVAPTDCTVLVTGETGTGKELVARAIHRRSQRAAHPFVSISCAAVPPSLIASELFGHERGAFTGALQRRPGRFELAAGGTLFLDEVGELPAETQIALLRVLQEREFERVGGTRPIRADVRVIAATNRDLQAAIDEGTFRSDLFYRLNVFPIEIPPLRERTEDIRALVEHFVARYAAKMGKTIRRIGVEALRFLEAYAWPGNVRELQNVIERSVIVCDSDVFSIDENWVPEVGRHGRERAAAAAPASAATLEGIKRAHIMRVLEESNWTLGGSRGAAARLGLKRTTLQSLLKRLGIAPPSDSTARLRPSAA
jgi:transcriptional regulator with GAF, ATPase, and Fis domain